MVQMLDDSARTRSGFALEPAQRLPVASQIVGQELDRDERWSRVSSAL
jgi:hypothetical protein